MQSGSGFGFRHQVGLFFARFCPAAWIGAAALFVIVGVIEVTRGGFDSTTKDQLVALRFPAFYVTGSVLLGLALLGTLLAGPSELLSAARRRTAIIAFAVILALMVIDYLFIYLPLLGMVSPPGQAKPASFASYHEASKRINLVELIICLLAAAMTSWPARQRVSEPPTSDPRKQQND